MRAPLVIPNWKKFQHYGKKTPTWIKLHRATLNSREWNDLSGNAAKLLVELWLVAAETEDGIIDTPTADLAWRLRRPLEMFETLLLELEKNNQVTLAVDNSGTVIHTAPVCSRPEVEVEVEERRSRGEQIKETAAVGSLIEYTVNGCAAEAHKVLGLGLWGDEFSRAFAQTKSFITRTWVASGVPLSEVHAAIHGLRIMVDRGDVDWLAERKGKPLDGIAALAKQALLPGPDGKQLRSLFSAAADAYRSHEQQKRRGPTTGPQRLTVTMPGPDGGFAA